jgi:4-oxalocrotonate tautomerase
VLPFAHQESDCVESLMPYVHVRITKDGVTTEQKAQIVAEMTQTLQRVLGKRPEHTHVIIEEIEPENWGFAGLLTPDYRKQQDSR